MSARSACRLLAALVVGLLAAVCLAAPAAADGLAVRRVDTTAFPLVRVEVAAGGTAIQPAGLTLEESGHAVQPEGLGPVAAAPALVVVVDTSGSMGALGRADQARALVRQLLAGRSGEAAIIAAGTPAQVVQAPTGDAAALERALGVLGPAGDSHLHDAVKLGAGLLADRPGGSMVVISDGRDVGSTASAQDARSAAAAAGVVHAVAIVGEPDLDRGTLQGLVAGGGSYREVADPRALPGLAAGLRADLGRRWLLSYRSTATGPFDVAVSAAGQRATATNVLPGERAVPGIEVVDPPASLGPLRSGLGAVIAAVLLFAAVAGGAWAVASLVAPGASQLDTTLEAYTLGRPGEDDGDADPGLATTAFVQRAVAITEQVARQRGLLVAVERRLEQADLKLRAGEVVFFAAAGVAMVGLLGLAFLPPLGALLVTATVAYLPFFVLGVMASRRRKAFVSQLPDTLNLLAGTLRSGYALLQGISAIVAEVDDPMAGELRKVLVEAQLGRDLDEALSDCAARMQSPDFEWAVMAIGIQREVGGNLAELLDTVADTMLQRERLRRDVSALTAEGKMSAIVLGGMTPALGLVMFVLNREYVLPLLTTTTGNIMLGVSGLWALFGFWWMKKTITIEI